MFNHTVFSRANWSKATIRTRLASFVQILFVLVFLTSQLGMSPTNAAAAASRPAAPEGLKANAGNAQVGLTWKANTETDLAGYNVYRSKTSPVKLTNPINSHKLVPTHAYKDAKVSNGVNYIYVVTAVNAAGNESLPSKEVSAKPSRPSSPPDADKAVAPMGGGGPLAPSVNALTFAGGAGNSYVSFGQATSTLGTATFTLEIWFKRTGAGTTANTGTGGVTAVPLLTKGMAESDGSTFDCNYFLGIRSSDNVLVADFEDSVNGLNHPIAGVTALPADSTWHHAAATYDGSKWQLFLDGKLEAELNVGKTPRADSIQWAGLGVAMTSAGTTKSGGFAGVLDEARIWNYARTQAEIQITMNTELSLPLADPSKLLGYWRMNEGSGTSLTDSSGHGVAGTLGGASLPVWAPGAGFPINVDTTAPATVAGLAAAAGDRLATLTWTANTETDLIGYNVYRSTSEPVLTTSPINGSNLIPTNRYVDGGLSNGTPYYYVVTAVDSSGNGSTAPTDMSATPVGATGYAMQFNGTSQYVTFGRASKLGAETFTIEGWFKRTGNGVTVTTGTGGVTGEPLITKGRDDGSDNTSNDINYFVGINQTSGFLVGDFEDTAGSGANHPITGTTSVKDGAWHHVAFTYDGAGGNIKLYLDGVQQGSTITLSKILPRADSIEHAAIGTALNSTGTPSGYFNGLIDEVRIWNYARIQTDLNTNKSVEILAAPGLLGRWGLNEGTGTQVNDTSGRDINGTATNGSTWATDTPFGAPPTPPAAPSGLGATAPTYSQVHLIWTDNANNETGFELERSTTGSGGPFSLLATVGVNTQAYDDLNLSGNQQYCYRVRAVNGAGPSVYAGPQCATTPAEGAYGLQFGSASAYAKFPNSSSLNTPTFTVETWFRRDGTGVGVTTGGGGITSAIPLITKGTSEGESAAADINYFVGIDASTAKLVADFEEAQIGASPSLNHPISGTTTIVNGTWYHAAATYDGTTWKLYLNGNLEATLAVGQPANAANTAPDSLGTSTKSDGNTTQGYFNGTFDEARIWNVARTQAEILSTINSQITTAQTGLLARWGLNEGSGTLVNGGAGTAVSGTISGTGYGWVTPGAPFNIVPPAPPAAPTGLSATGGNTVVNLTWTGNSEPDLAGYNVYRYVAPSTYTKANTSLLTSPAYVVNGLTNGTPYTFVVTAVNTASNESAYSSPATATPFGDITPPAAPTGLGATGGPSLINLTWTANGEPDLAGYNLYRSTTHNGPYAKVNTPLITGTAYSDTTVTNGTPYYYVLRAVDTSTNESGNSSEVSATPAEAATGLQFASGSSQYVTFGAAPGLGVQTFTIETWFKKTGFGVTTSTGTGGLTAVPLVTKGRGEAENTNQDMNYFFGIDSTGVLAADLEECARAQTGCPATVSNLTQGGQNYPAKGSTVIQDNIWYHAAVTFDGRYWKLYLNGVQDGATTDTGENRYPRWDSIQHAGIGTAMTSTGAAAGFFNGVVDEVRIWNVARTPAEIMGTINSQITGPQTGLVARWGMGEGTGTTINSSIGSFPGTLTNGPTFVAGAPFNIAPPTAPAAPTLLSAMPTAGLAIDLAWTDNSSNETSFKIERSPLETGSWTQIGTAAAGAVAYTDGGLDPATQYCYRVRASNSVGDSDYSNVSCADTAGTPNNGLNLGSSNAYVTFGPAPSLGAQSFTVETWFKRTGTGVAVSTGTNGVTAVPLVTKGSPEADGSNLDENYILGIRSSDNVLAGDFETFAACNSRPAGDNTPIVGVTPIVNDTWYHAAFTYDGTALKLYLNGNLEATLASTCIPRYDSIQHAGLGTYLTSTGTSSGYFQGALDEVRIWNVARTQAEIQGTLNSAITSPQAYLVGRWGLDETSGATVLSSAGTSVDGTITGGSSWGPGAPAIVNHTPAFVSGTPSDGATGISTSPTLTVNVSDSDLDNQTISFYGRPKDGAGADFTLVAIPDPQYYASTYPSIYNAQMQWVVDNKISRNIAYVAGLGDNVDSAATTAQWDVATAAWDKLTTGGIPYGIEAGNHDGAPSGTANFNTNFGGRKSSQTTFGGRYGTSDYDNYYTFFDVSGMHFIVVYIEYDDSMTSTSNPVLVWANTLLSTNSTKRAIVVTHNLLQGGSSNSFSTQGQAVYDALKGNPNLFLMMGGHLDVARRRADTYSGNTVYSLRSDYQFVGGEQSGYLRILRFSPADNTIHVSTYSPTLNQDYPDETPPQNAFDLPYTMIGSSAFTLIGTDNNVPAGTDASMVWPGLANSTQYEWYAETSDGRLVATSDTRGFTTEAGVTCYALTLNHTGQGSDLVASPANSTGCPAGQYVATESISLSGAAPTAGWQIASWTGTNNNASTASINTVTMPSSAHTAGVNYTAITHSISLVSGWNLISFNLHPVNTDTAAVLSSIAGHYDLVYAWDAAGGHSTNGNWMKYDPLAPVYQNTLASLDETMGFWIHMTSPATLIVIGTVPVATNIPVLNDVGGWNLVAYPSAVNRALPDVLRDHGVGTDFSRVYANHAVDTADPWKLYDPAAPTWANDLTEMSPGWGYWVWVGGDHTWSVGYGAP